MMSAAQTLLIGAVRGYRYALSPWLGNACRFEPTCSVYAIEALQRHGAGIGAGLAIGRIARCHPWCEGGVDLVPSEPPRLFTRWLTAAPEGPEGRSAAATERPTP